MHIYMHDYVDSKGVEEIVQFVYRQLGFPIIKVEITREQIVDNIQRAWDLYMMYAIGTITEEQYHAIMLIGGQQEYNLGNGIIDVLEFNEYGIYSSGINTLFTLQNQMNSAGLLDFSTQGNNTLMLLNYHLVLDFIETVQRYSSSIYQWSYDEVDKVLHISPEPKHTLKSVYIETENKVVNVDSPGWVLLKVKQFLGVGRPGWNFDKALARILHEYWIRMYTLALCKITLGTIRQKFPNFSSIGTTGINLDGSDLISEGQSEKENLEKQLIEDQLFAGMAYGIDTFALT